MLKLKNIKNKVLHYFIFAFVLISIVSLFGFFTSKNFKLSHRLNSKQQELVFTLSNDNQKLVKNKNYFQYLLYKKLKVNGFSDFSIKKIGFFNSENKLTITTNVNDASSLAKTITFYNHITIFDNDINLNFQEETEDKKTKKKIPKLRSKAVNWFSIINFTTFELTGNNTVVIKLQKNKSLPKNTTGSKKIFINYWRYIEKLYSNVEIKQQLLKKVNPFLPRYNIKNFSKNLKDSFLKKEYFGSSIWKKYNKFFSTDEVIKYFNDKKIQKKVREIQNNFLIGEYISVEKDKITISTNLKNKRLLKSLTNIDNFAHLFGLKLFKNSVKTNENSLSKTKLIIFIFSIILVISIIFGALYFVFKKYSIIFFYNIILFVTTFIGFLSIFQFFFSLSSIISLLIGLFVVIKIVFSNVKNFLLKKKVLSKIKNRNKVIELKKKFLQAKIKLADFNIIFLFFIISFTFYFLGIGKFYILGKNLLLLSTLLLLFFISNKIFVFLYANWLEKLKLKFFIDNKGKNLNKNKKKSLLNFFTITISSTRINTIFQFILIPIILIIVAITLYFGFDYHNISNNILFLDGFTIAEVESFNLLKVLGIILGITFILSIFFYKVILSLLYLFKSIFDIAWLFALFIICKITINERYIFIVFLSYLISALSSFSLLNFLYKKINQSLYMTKENNFNYNKLSRVFFLYFENNYKELVFYCFLMFLLFYNFLFFGSINTIAIGIFIFIVITSFTLFFLLYTLFIFFFYILYLVNRKIIMYKKNKIKDPEETKVKGINYFPSKNNNKEEDNNL